MKPTTFAEFYLFVLNFNIERHYPTKDFLDIICSGAKKEDAIVSRFCLAVIDKLTQQMFEEH